MPISMQGVFYFVFFYPLFMAFFWMIGAVLFFYRHEKGATRPPRLPTYPLVSIIVPCHNEGSDIEETIVTLDKNGWPALAFPVKGVTISAVSRQTEFPEGFEWKSEVPADCPFELSSTVQASCCRKAPVS